MGLTPGGRQSEGIREDGRHGTGANSARWFTSAVLGNIYGIEEHCVGGIITWRWWILKLETPYAKQWKTDKDPEGRISMHASPLLLCLSLFPEFSDAVWSSVPSPAPQHHPPRFLYSQFYLKHAMSVTAASHGKKSSGNLLLEKLRKQLWHSIS